MTRTVHYWKGRRMAQRTFGERRRSGRLSMRSALLLWLLLSLLGWVAVIYGLPLVF